MADYVDFTLGDESERDRLILEHIPLLKHIVGRMSFDLSGGLDRDDLYGFGMLGLIAAADSWDASRGLKFSTYAYTRIRGAILDELRRMDFLPRGRREKVRELDRAIRKMEQENGGPPSPEQVGAELGIDAEEVDEILLQARSSSEASLSDGPTAQLASMLSDPKSESPVGSVEWEEMRELLVKVVSTLPEQEQTVINLYYGEELLLKEISGILGVTESRVSQIHSRALYRLNKNLTALIGVALSRWGEIVMDANVRALSPVQVNAVREAEARRRRSKEKDNSKAFELETASKASHSHESGHHTEHGAVSAREEDEAGGRVDVSA